MFYSAGIPAILPLWQEGRIERSHVSMTEKISTDSQGGDWGSLSGDALALSMLYERFRRPIHSYIYHMLGNQEDADDITQEVFVRACIAWQGLRDRDNLSAWLYRIATNLCVDLLRRRKRISWWPLSMSSRSRDDEHNDGPISDDFSHLLADSGGIPEIAEREYIQLVLARMPVEYASVLILSAGQGVPYQEIATIVGISANAAATRISRAKKMFAEQYQRLSTEGSEKQENRR